MRHGRRSNLAIRYCGRFEPPLVAHPGIDGLRRMAVGLLVYFSPPACRRLPSLPTLIYHG